MAPIPPHIVATFKQNLAALRTRDPDLARCVEEVAWPEDLRFLPALDQTPSAFSREFGRSGWFGYSGAPRVREKVICGRFEAGGANVIFPAAGQGWGLRCLLDRFEPHQAIFVWEPNRLHLAVLFGLYDFSADIRDGRVFFLTDGDIRSALVRCLDANPGLVHPAKMMSWPWISENEIQEITRQVEQAVQDVAARAAARVGTLQDRLMDVLGAADPGRNARVQIVALSPLPPVHRLARDLARGLETLNRRADVFLLDRPEHGSTIAVLNRMIEFGPGMIVSVGAEKKDWRIPLPPEIPFFSILALPGVILGEALPENLVPAEKEVFVLGSLDDFQRLSPRVPAHQLFVMDLAVSPDEFYPREETRQVQVLVLADRTDPDPEKVGICQQSHQFLWDQIRQRIEESPLSYSHARAGQLVQQVSRQTGIAFTDPTVARTFEDLVKTRLAPAAVAAALVRSCRRAKLSVRILGCGWEADPEEAALAQPLPNAPAAVNELLNAADVVLYVDHETNWRQIVFDALCAGTPVLVRRLPDDRLAALPEIARAVTFLHPGEDPGAQVRAAVNRRPDLVARTRQAREFLTGNFSFPRILEKLLEPIPRGSP